jgi:hypothetical protein
MHTQKVKCYNCGKFTETYNTMGYKCLTCFSLTNFCWDCVDKVTFQGYIMTILCPNGCLENTLEQRDQYSSILKYHDYWLDYYRIK